MSSLILGVWFFSSLIYNGASLPRPNPDLIMTLNFQDKQINTLHYSRNNEVGFCERKAQYEYDGKNLKQTVIWVNPDNAPSCSQDADMRLGQVSTTPVRTDKEALYMDLPLGEEQLTFVWTRSLSPQ